MKIQEELHQDLQNAEAEFLKLKDGMKRRWTRAIVRWILTVILVVWLWENEWVRLSLWVVVPLALFNLGMMIAMPRLLEKKLAATRTKIAEVEQLIETPSQNGMPHNE